MAETTGISWCDATFNPWVGCSKVSPGCANCYAETLVTGRMGRAGTWGEAGTRERTSEANWRKPLAWARSMPAKLGRRPRVFCASLADVFEPRPELEEWRRELFDLIARTPELDWLLLTKRPEEARDWLRGWYERGGSVALYAQEWTSREGIPWGVLPNVWMGTSIENSRFTWRADVLREIPATVRFLSCEPLLGSLFAGPTSGESPDGADGPRQPDEGSIPSGSIPGPSSEGGRWARADSPGAPAGAGAASRLSRAPLSLDGIDWVIVGGESGGRDARPMHPDWAREIRDATQIEADARDSGYGGQVAFHFKQWGAWTPDPNGRDPNAEWVSPDGRSRSRMAADMYDDLPDGSVRMRFSGSSPKAGGKLLDGAEWCEFPGSPTAVPA